MKKQKVKTAIIFTVITAPIFILFQNFGYLEEGHIVQSSPVDYEKCLRESKPELLDSYDPQSTNFFPINVKRLNSGLYYSFRNTLNNNVTHYIRTSTDNGRTWLPFLESTGPLEFKTSSLGKVDIFYNLLRSAQGQSLRIRTQHDTDWKVIPLPTGQYNPTSPKVIGLQVSSTGVIYILANHWTRDANGTIISGYALFKLDDLESDWTLISNFTGSEIINKKITPYTFTIDERNNQILIFARYYEKAFPGPQVIGQISLNVYSPENFEFLTVQNSVGQTFLQVYDFADAVSDLLPVSICAIGSTSGCPYGVLLGKAPKPLIAQPVEAGYRFTLRNGDNSKDGIYIIAGERHEADNYTSPHNYLFLGNSTLSKRGLAPSKAIPYLDGSQGRSTDVLIEDGSVFVLGSEGIASLQEGKITLRKFNCKQ